MTLTTAEKQARHLQRKTAKINAKAKADAGIFAEQVQLVTVADTYWHTRRKLAEAVEHTCTLLLGGKILGSLAEALMRREALAAVGADNFAKLDAYRWKTYPNDITYGYGFWRKVMTGEAMKYNARPTGEIRKTTVGEFNVVAWDIWPPEGWQAPMTNDQFRERFPTHDEIPAHDDGGLSDSIGFLKS